MTGFGVLYNFQIKFPTHLALHYMHVLRPFVLEKMLDAKVFVLADVHHLFTKSAIYTYNCPTFLFEAF